MKPFRVADDIVPLAQAKAQLSRVVRDVRSHGRPVVITQNGKPAVVVLSAEEFDRLRGRADFVRSVEEGLADSEAGRLVSDRELGRELDERLGGRRRSRTRPR